MCRLAIVIPCYNEEEVLEEVSFQLKELLKKLISSSKISSSSYIMFVNDGSKDSSWQIISKLHRTDKMFKGVNLAGNVGHQNALLAGLVYVKDKCDIAISIDADLQDDIEAIEEMVDKYKQGSDIVYGVRKKRHNDMFLKKITAQIFYKIMRFLGVNTIYNHADYRLMSSRALNQLSLYREINLFLRGIVPLIGYKTDIVYYVRKKRFAGASKYPFVRMINFALDGITSFSVRPIRYILFIGITIFFISIISFIYIGISYLKGGSVAGWTSVMASVWFLGSVTIISLGIIGEYIGKIYSEVKSRPRYNIESVLFEE